MQIFHHDRVAITDYRMRQAHQHVIVTLMTNADWRDHSYYDRASAQVIHQNRTFHKVGQIQKCSLALTTTSIHENHTSPIPLGKTQRSDLLDTHSRQAASTKDTDLNHANRNLSAPTFPHPSKRTHIPYRGLLCDMVPALQANRAHLQPTLYHTCLARKVRFRKSQCG
jgi:hypothetical protein